MPCCNMVRIHNREVKTQLWMTLQRVDLLSNRQFNLDLFYCRNGCVLLISSNMVKEKASYSLACLCFGDRFSYYIYPFATSTVGSLLLISIAER